LAQKYISVSYDPNYDIEMSVINRASKTNLVDSRKDPKYPLWKLCNYSKKII